MTILTLFDNHPAAMTILLLPVVITICLVVVYLVVGDHKKPR